MRDPTSVEATGWTSSGYSKPPSSAPWPTTLTWFPAFVLPGVGAEKVLVVQAARVGRMIQLHTESPNIDTETIEALGALLLETLATPNVAPVKSQYVSCHRSCFARTRRHRVSPSWLQSRHGEQVGGCCCNWGCCNDGLRSVR